MGLTATVAILTIGLAAAAEQKKAFENPPLKLDAALIVPDGKMEGKGYKIDKQALTVIKTVTP